jgi:hypothetical protein
MPQRPNFKDWPKYLLSMLVPAGFICFVAFYLIPNSLLPQPGAIPLAILWGALGASTYYIGKKKGFKWQLGLTGALAVLSVAVGFALPQVFSATSQDLQTCPVCGFETLDAEGQTCAVCHVSYTEATMQLEAYHSMDELLKASQIIFFLPESDKDSVDFFGPCNCKENFRKNPGWQPSVTAKEVLEVSGLAK